MTSKNPKTAVAPAASSRTPARSAPGTSEHISYQGEPGANSHLACQEVLPELTPLPCPTFEDAIAAVKSGEARYAMIPIENSQIGRAHV